MSYEMLVGLEVINDAGYQAYREGIAPILAEHGGVFRYDLTVNDLLKAPEGEQFNRVFLLQFPSAEQQKAFFKHEEYQKIKAKYFTQSVTQTYLLSVNES